MSALFHLYLCGCKAAEWWICMRKQLRGIALILFGILLAIVSVATEPFSAGESYMIWSIVAGVCGIAGLVIAFAKE